MYLSLLIVSIGLICLTIPMSSHATPLKPRIIVLTDISPVNHEPDDMESLIRLLVHADLFEIEGLVATTGWSYSQVTKDNLNLIHKVIDAYEKDLPNLLKRSGQTDFLRDESRQEIGYWPSPDYLRNRTVLGSKYRGMEYIGADNNSDGSNLIIDQADKDDDRPVWVTVWGGANTLAQAIWQVQQTRSDAELKAFLHKIRAYTITDQDRHYNGSEGYEVSSHQWMRREFEKDLLFIWDECSWKFQNGTGKSNWDDYTTHIQGHGNLGGIYPKYRYGVEGDTPSFLHIMPNGLNNPDDPTQCGWGGYSVWQKGTDQETYAHTNQTDSTYNTCQKYEKYLYPATFDNFAARMDWAKDGKGNRNPVVVIDDNEGIEILTKKPQPGTAVTLDASGTYDPDNDALTFNWWIQPEAGTYSEKVTISDSESSVAKVNVPSDSAGKTFHVICEVTDNGTHNLTSYRRIIFEPTSPSLKKASGGALDGNRHRALISTDIGGTDDDDFQSMIHYLLYADLFDTEGLLSSPFDKGRVEDILKVIAKYEQDYPRLKEHSGNYPEPDFLRFIAKQGAIDPSPPEGYSHATEGSEWIIRCARKEDTRPLYVLVWGLISDVAQALHDAPDISEKIRVIFIGGPNKKWDLNAYNYIEQNFPDLWMIENNSTYRGWWVGGNQDGDMGNQSFVEENIKGHGSLGDYFVHFKNGKIKMGDTPTMAYLLKGDPDDPTGDSWGGRFVRAENRPRFVFAESTSETDSVELFGIFELLMKASEICGQNLELKVHFRHPERTVDADVFPGDDGFYYVRFMPQNEGCWEYVIESNLAEIDGRTGRFTCVAPSLDMRYDSQPSHKNWWVDDPDPALMEEEHYGVKTISQWRGDYLRDFARRMDRCLGS